jgi:hypothetical protein
VAKLTNKPVIPEPSLHFVFWCGVIGLFTAIAVIALDYANGWAR